MRKLILAALSGSVLVLTLTGCVVFQSPPTATQQDVIGGVRVNFTLCPSEIPESPDATENTPDSHDGCPDNGNGGSFMGDPTSDGDYQVLVGFRVPVGTAPPTTFAAGAASSGLSGPLSFVRSTSYEGALSTSVPPPAGQTWVGYISNVYSYSDGADNTPAQTAVFDVDFGLPRPATSAPFASPFRIRPVVGARSVTSDLPPGRRVSCGDDAFSTSGGSFGGSSMCVDAPSEATTATNIDVPTRDLGIAPGSVTVSPGQTVAVPFDARVNGTLPAGTTFAVSSTTDLPGATANPSVTSLTPGAGSNTRITVPIAVPKGRGPGLFSVGLTAQLANGQVRTGTGTLTVRDTQKPKVSKLKVSPKTLRPSAPSIAAAGTRVSYRSSEAAKVKFTVQRCRKAKAKKGKKRKTKCKTAKGSFTDQASAGANSFRFTGFLRNKALKPGSYKLVGVATDPAKNKGKSVKASFRIKK